MEDSPRKGWVFIAMNKHIASILLALIEARLKHGKRLPKKVVSDLTVIRVMLIDTLVEIVEVTEP